MKKEILLTRMQQVTLLSCTYQKKTAKDIQKNIHRLLDQNNITRSNVYNILKELRHKNFVMNALPDNSAQMFRLTSKGNYFKLHLVEAISINLKDEDIKVINDEMD